MNPYLAPDPYAAPPQDPYAVPGARPDPYLAPVRPATQEPLSSAPWAAPAPTSPPAPPPVRTGRGLWRYAPIPAALLLAVGIVWGAVALRDEPSGDGAAPATSESSADPTPAPPSARPSGPLPVGTVATGDYTIRLVDSGLCVGEGPEPGNTDKIVLVQSDCATATPPMALKEFTPGVFQLQLKNPQLGTGCVEPDGPDVEMLYRGAECDDHGTAPEQLFGIEAAEGGGHRIRNAASGHCFSVVGGGLTAGVAFIQARCGGPAQVFTFETP
ncbi:RICIN domain-containing protein [Phytomonospora sp. NPDC050363]|uniref:RICIN domain-containing protein n=1 Tax=Phytomonospora sp. NPDC050363 TaxID=3155642 RepID=UPI0033FC9B7A